MASSTGVRRRYSARRACCSGLRWWRWRRISDSRPRCRAPAGSIFFQQARKWWFRVRINVETVGHNPCAGKMLPHQRTVPGSQIHADELDLLLAFEPLQITLQRRLTAPGDDVVDLVVLQIAKGGRVTAAASEKMLIYA